MHAFCILADDDVQQLVQFRADSFHLCRCTGIEQNFLKQEVIFAQYAFGNGHVALESSSRCVLMFHDGGKHESGYERNGQRIGHGFIMFFETVFKDVQAEALVKVLEEHFAQIVSLLDDDGVLRA